MAGTGRCLVRGSAICLVLALVAGVPAGVSATTVVPPALEALVAAAERIVVTEVVATQARALPSADAGLITTTVTFKVMSTLKGPARSQQILEFPGGTVGNDTLELVGLPRFGVGDQDVLFIAEGGRPLSPLVGFAYGRVRLTREPDSGVQRVAAHNGRPIESVDALWSSPHGGARERRGVPLDVFIEVVRAVAAAQGAAAALPETRPEVRAIPSAWPDLSPLADGAANRWRRPQGADSHLLAPPEAVRRPARAASRGTVDWANDVFGWSFNPGLLAVAIRRHAPDGSVTRVRLNASVASSSSTDLSRLLAHEVGHMLGLDHADALGEPAVAVMNAGPDRADEPTAIDAATATAAAASTASLAFPPRAETLDFRNRLETKYLEALRRPLDAVYVDAEGVVVWIQEYLRYRLLACSNDEAVERVVAQIRGLGVQAACAASAEGAAFPPRHETMAFRLWLEAFYRDELRRGTVATAVDVEGDVVWTQEYLRHRLARCTHEQAVARVMDEIDGAPPRVGCATGDDPDGAAPVIENPSRLLFQSPDHSRMQAYEYGVFDPGASSPAVIVALPLEVLAFDGADFALDLRAYPLVPRGRVVTLRVRGRWVSGATEWSAPSQPLAFR